MTVTGFEVAHFGSRMIAMTKPAFTALSSVARGVPAIVFVPSRKQTQLTAIDIMTYAAASGEPHRFLGEGIDPSALTAVIEADIRDPALQPALSSSPFALQAAHSTS